MEEEKRNKKDKKAKKEKKKKPQRVKPQLLKGFRDYDPGDQIARERMIGKVREAFELMGFLPLQTPSLEMAATLLGSHYSEDSLAELFGFNGPDEIDMALRYEFTLSLARYVASQSQMTFPFRRYQYGNVWRVDKPGPGRYREFMQFDIDIVGSRNMLADSEIIAAMVTTLEHLGVNNFEVRYSNRKILNGLIEWASIPIERGQDVMRVLDKFEKQGKLAVLQEMGKGRIDDSGAKIPGLNLPEEQIEKLKRFLDEALIRNYDNPLEWVEHNLSGFKQAEEGIEELKRINSHLQQMGIGPDRAGIDLTIVRGLGYYTGPVFETTLSELPKYGSIFSGGRYDNLLDRFQSQSVPAVGSSMGLDRLLAALIELKMIKKQRATSQVLVTVMDQDSLPEYLTILKELRENNIRSEIFAGDTKNLTRQVRYADRVGIPFVVIAGSDEFKSGELTIKNLTAGADKAADTSDRKEWLSAEGFQEKIKRSDLVSYLKSQFK